MTTYRDAGVDIGAGEDLVERIKPLAKATHRTGVMRGIGGFAALFDLKATGYRDPVLVSSTDGVGTKLRLAVDTGIHDGIGIDLVAMCVNDLVVQGAQPLFFLDYFSTGKLDVDQAEWVIGSIAKGCEIAGCALVGGETAEMPGMYEQGHYDLAGFAVGAVERDSILPKGILPGSTVIGLASSGVHSNGFSLVNRLILDQDHDTLMKLIPITVALMKPTRIYVKSVLALHKAGLLWGAAHITGGGLAANLTRILPGHTQVVIDSSTWPEPEIFRWIAETGKVSKDEMRKVFNCGIGMVLIVRDAPAAMAMLAALDEEAYIIGEVRDHRAFKSTVMIS